MGSTPMASTIESPCAVMTDLLPAAHAFDAIASGFDARFNSWQSVSAQRRAVRDALLNQFPAKGRILELGGGTGQDASFLAMQGFQVVLTDPSPAMVSIARAKLAPHGGQAVVASAEGMDDFAIRQLSTGEPRFDGAFSNFAPLNCVPDLTQTALGLARLLKPGASAMLVVFGTFCPGEMLTEILRRRPQLALRRLQTRDDTCTSRRSDFRHSLSSSPRSSAHIRAMVCSWRNASASALRCHPVPLSHGSPGTRASLHAWRLVTDCSLVLWPSSATMCSINSDERRPQFLRLKTT